MKTLTAQCPLCRKDTRYLADEPIQPNGRRVLYCSPCFWKKVEEKGYPTRISALNISGQAIILTQTTQ